MFLPAANLVSLVHESEPSQIGKVQFLQLGSSPNKTSARVDFPTPVAPRIRRCGNGSSSSFLARIDMICNTMNVTQKAVVAEEVNHIFSALFQNQAFILSNTVICNKREDLLLS